LGSPVFPPHFEGYSMMEDVSLSLVVGRHWRLANVRTARIFHDSQVGSYKANIAEVSRMELLNRHYVMTEILRRRRWTDYGKLIVWECFQLAVGAVNYRLGRKFWGTLAGKVVGTRELIVGR